MKEHILCAIDFSDSSISALRWAHKIAKGSNAHLSVLYSYRLLQTERVSDLRVFKKTIEEESKRRFCEVSDIFDGSNEARSFIIEIGFYSDNIENYVRKHPNTLVVLSDEMANTIYNHKGQTLQHFLKQLHVPLTIVPNWKHTDSSSEQVSRVAV